MSFRPACDRETLHGSGFRRRGIDHKLDFRNAVRGKASELGVITNPLFVGRDINAIDLVGLLDPTDWFQHYSLGLGYEGTGKLQECDL